MEMCACRSAVFVAVQARLTGLTSITLSLRGSWALSPIVLRHILRDPIGRILASTCSAMFIADAESRYYQPHKQLWGDERTTYNAHSMFRCLA
jgi:hypothetical protein